MTRLKHSLTMVLSQMMARIFFIFPIAVIVILLLFWSCMGSKKAKHPSAGEDHTVRVYLSKRGWHTGLLIEKHLTDTVLTGLLADFPRARYLNISWGDRKFFMADQGTVILALRAAILPTQSVMHVDGYTHLPKGYFQRRHMLKIDLSYQRFRSMLTYIKKGFARDDAGKLIRLRSDTLAMSGFYLSNITYWGTRTCNVWTAKALQKAGLPVKPFIALTARNLMNQVRKNN